MGKDTKKNSGVKKVTASYEKDSKRFYRYLIDSNPSGIVGTIYMPKDKDKTDMLSLTFNHQADEEE